MILSGGLKFLLLSAVLYAPGTILYFWARREQNERVFTQSNGSSLPSPWWAPSSVFTLWPPVRSPSSQWRLTCRTQSTRLLLLASIPRSANCARSWFRAPGRAHQRLTPSNCDALLFDDVLWVDVAQRDHFDFIQKMRARGASKSWRCTTCWPRRLRSPRRRNGSSTIRSCPIRWVSAWWTKSAATSRGCPTCRAGGDADRGLSTYEFPDTHGGEMLRLVREAASVTEYLLPPLPTTLYTRDTTCWIYGGVTLNPLYWPARHRRTILATAIHGFHPDFAGRVNDGWWGRPGARTGAWPLSKVAT